MSNTNNGTYYTDEQKALADQLAGFYNRLKQPYLGSIYSLQQKNYPDRFVHFAHSLREVIDLLSKKSGPQKTNNKKHDRKLGLKLNIDPLGTNGTLYDAEYEFLDAEYKDLSNIAHHGKKIDEEHAQEKLKKIEDSLKKLTTAQLSIHKEIDEIMSASPSTEGAKKIIEMSFRQATLNYVVKNLSCVWLYRMYESGFFNNPQPAVFTNNIPHYHFWQPSEYLKKCGMQNPQLITKIILNCKFNKEKERNPYIYADFLSCATSLPISNGAMIAQKSLDEKWYNFVEYKLIKQYVILAKRLFSEQLQNLAMNMFRKAFEPKNNHKIIYSHSDYWYEEHFTDVITSLQSENRLFAISLLCYLLDKALEIETGLDSKSDMQPRRTDIWRPAIETHEQNWSEGQESLYVEFLHKNLAYLGQEDIKSLMVVMSQMAKKSHMIFRRIELYVYSTFPSNFVKEIEQTLLDFFDNTECYHEYYNLNKCCFGHASKQTQDKILSMIDSESNEREILLKLTPIAKYLAGERAVKFENLQEKLGMFEHSDFRHYHGASMGGKPEPANIFDGRTANQVFNIAKSHKPQTFYPFDDPVAVAFEEYVTRNPSACSSHASELKDADNIFQYYFFSGIRAAIEQKADVHWDRLLSLIEHLITNCNDYHITRSYDGISRIYDLVEKALDLNAINYQYKDRLWTCIKNMIELATKHPGKEEYPTKDGPNSFNIALNSINGVSFLIAYRYAVWCEKHTDTKKFFEPNVKQVIDDYVNNKLLPKTVSRHAILGISLTGFHYYDREWAKDIVQKISSDRNLKVAFWDSYVSYSKLFPAVYDDFHTLYASFLNGELLVHPETKLAYDSTISHMTLAYFYDFYKADDYLEGFLKKVDSDGYRKKHKNDEETSIQHCAFFISRLILDKNDDEKFNKEKLVKLWKHKVFADQANLHLWFKNSPLDKETTIKLFNNYLDKYPHQINLAFSHIKELKDYLPDYPYEVADCLQILIEKQKDHYISSDVKELLELLTNNPQVPKDKCKKIIELLSRLGHDFRDLL